MSSDPYSKQLPMSSSGYTAEPQELPHLQTSMPSMQLSLVTSDQPGQQQAPGGGSTQVPPIRTQYASYVSSSAAAPSLSAASAAGGSLSVPRYVDVDTNPRPTKSPRHPSHPSIHGSISSTDSPSNNTNTEYRYGAPSAGPAAYGSISSASAGGGADNISPTTTHSHHGGQQQHHHQSAGGSAYHHSSPSGAHESSSGGSTQPPPRDYYPSSASWTTTAGESSAPTYTNGDHRASYSYSTADQYKTPGVKSDPHAPPPPVYPGQATSHYSWNS